MFVVIAPAKENGRKQQHSWENVLPPTGCLETESSHPFGVGIDLGQLMQPHITAHCEHHIKPFGQDSQQVFTDSDGWRKNYFYSLD